jgi:hypothetical protein
VTNANGEKTKVTEVLTSGSWQTGEATYGHYSAGRSMLSWTKIGIVCDSW